MTTTTASSADIFAAVALHLDVLDRFITVVQGRLAVADDPFVRDSLADLLMDLNDQHDAYLVAESQVVAA
ncbi:hypothetical protein [Azospirillum agricola]|uniref:hypothetical protein n=1 Tax=Azospirillum agricola TaxID=1720247 RepID=UPI000A0F155B|nr:hypothetical protein [Azospirillum agricola]SMH41423.1 hypothetical protein SAMN02982994_1726 [Azospirillum lipoferum]